MPRATRFLAFALLLGAAGHAQAARESLHFDIDGLERRVLLHVPAGRADAERPRVIVFHGRGDDAEPFARAVKLHADWPEAIVAYPRGEWHEKKRQRGWQYRVGQYDDRDLKLVDRLLALLDERYGAAPDRTFAAGFSNGGHFTWLLMGERSERFAAFAVIGSVLPEFVSEAPPRPLLYLFGRGEDPQYQDDWQRTIEALVRHQRTRGPLRDVFGCCKRQTAGEGGAPFVFGTYNAGHIWPDRGNEWLRAFFHDPSIAAKGD